MLASVVQLGLDLAQLHGVPGAFLLFEEDRFRFHFHGSAFERWLMVES
jgi:hypothetical protein